MTPWSETSIAGAVARQILNRKCLVLVDNCQWTGHECDVLGVTMAGYVVDVEVKISRADLKADAKKSKWWHRQYSWVAGEQPVPIARQWPARVWKHYYCMPADIWKPELLAAMASPKSGVLLLRRTKSDAVIVDVERRAVANRDARKLDAVEILDIARLASLRLWDAYKTRDDAVAELWRQREAIGEAA